jgi:hypothetical protein
MPRSFMAKVERPEKYNRWLNELDSLGISTLQKNGQSNHKESSDLTEPVKLTLYDNYLQAYSENNISTGGFTILFPSCCLKFLLNQRTRVA